MLVIILVSSIEEWSLIHGEFKALRNDTSREFSNFDKEYHRHCNKILQINDMIY